MRLTELQSYEISTIILLFIIFNIFRKIFTNQTMEFGEIILEGILLFACLGMTKLIVNNIVYQPYVDPNLIG
jgi:hypothetical protein